MRYRKDGRYTNTIIEYCQVGRKSQYSDCRNKENDSTSKLQLLDIDSSRYL